MSYLSLIYYPLLAILLLWGFKHCIKGEWNDEFLSLSQSKAIQGFCAVCIMFHHMSQRTCVLWIPGEYITHGLDLFYNIGYLCVAVFFFFSGYGLFKSFKTKENYFKHYFTKRILPILLVSLITELMFLLFYMYRDAEIGISTVFSSNGPMFVHPYTWYIYAIIYIYIAFFISFKLIKNERISFVSMFLFVLIYILFCNYMGYGNWWYNSILLFPFGLCVAKYEKSFLSFCRKFYLPLTIVSIIFFVITYAIDNLSTIIFTFVPAGYTISKLTEFLSQEISAVFFVFLILLWNMKNKIGNKCLSFVGKMTLEIYLVHGFYSYLFSFAFVDDNVAPLLYIKNVFLYVLAVLVLSIPSAYVIHLFMGFVSKTIRDKQRDAVYEPKNGKSLIEKIIPIVIIALIWGMFAVTSVRMYSKGKDSLKAYADNNLTLVDSSGTSIAVSVTGEGNNTIVILADSQDPAPVLTYNLLANDLSKKGNKVIIIDRPGMLFSDNPASKRTSENLANEVEDVLEALSEEEPVIFVSCGNASLICQKYASLYPDKVKGIFAIDPFVGEMLNDYNDLKEYKMQIKRETLLNSTGQILMELTGLSPINGAAYSDLDFRKESYENKNLLENVYSFYMYDKAYIKENKALPDNLKETVGVKYPQDLPVVFFLTERRRVGTSTSVTDLFGCQLQNSDIQHVKNGLYSTYGVYYNPSYFALQIQNFIDEINE